MAQGFEHVIRESDLIIQRVGARHHKYFRDCSDRRSRMSGYHCAAKAAKPSTVRELVCHRFVAHCGLRCTDARRRVAKMALLKSPSLNGYRRMTSVNWPSARLYAGPRPDCKLMHGRGISQTLLLKRSMAMLSLPEQNETRWPNALS